MTFHQWADYVNVFSGERPDGIRLGQWAFTVLFESYPDIADAVTGTSVDPFYVDARIPAFLIFLLDQYVEMESK